MTEPENSSENLLSAIAEVVQILNRSNSFDALDEWNYRRQLMDKMMNDLSNVQPPKLTHWPTVPAPQQVINEHASVSSKRAKRRNRRKP